MWIARASFTVLLLCLACAQSGDDTPDDRPNRDAGTSADGGTNADGGVDDDAPLTLSPFECQADLTALHDEDFEVREHPVPYKGHLFVSRRIPTKNGNKTAAVSLLDDRILVIQEQPIPGVSDDFAFIYGIGNQPITAPDYGDQNDPEYPVALIAQLVANQDRRNILLRISAKGAIRVALTSGDSLRFGGTVQSFGGLRIGASDDAFFFLNREDDPTTYLVRQGAPGAPVTVVLAEGASLRSIETDPRSVAEFHRPIRPTPFGDVVVRVSVQDAAEKVTGYAYLRVSGATGDAECLATNDFALDCGGVLVNETREMMHFDSDGATIGGVLNGPGVGPELHYKVLGLPIVESIERNVEVQGFTFNNFKTTRACPTNNALYFVGSFSGSGRGSYDELMRITENGTIEQITNFGALLDVAALKGESPNEIRNFALGYNCDAVMYTWGHSREDSNNGYEGYWAAYQSGDVVEVIDETAARTDNGNGDVTDVSRARSGIDPNADAKRMVTVGPDGAFYFISTLRNTDGEIVRRYFKAEKPINRCREPVDVNSTGDDADQTPGDGECDTGGVIDGDPECTLRAAIEETNARPGSDEVRVSLPAGSTVQVTRGLPAVRSRLTIDGAGLVVDGSNLTGDEIGVDIEAPSTTIRSMTVTGFPSHGIRAAKSVSLESIGSTHNGGWGVWLEDKASITGGATTSSIAYNGAAAPAGGIFSKPLVEQGLGLRLSDVSSSHNNGPGVMAMGYVQAAGDVTTSDNRGAGFHLEGGGGFIQTRLGQPYGTLTVRRNLDHGIFVVAGHLEFDWGRVRADDNCRFGVYAENGHVHLGGSQVRARSMAHSLSRNGVGAGGVAWRLDDDARPASSPIATCAGGGIGIVGTGPSAALGPSRVITATIADNQGPGVATTDAFHLVDVGVHNNRGAGVVFFDEIGDTELTDIVVRFGQGPQSWVQDNSGPGVHIDVGSLGVRAPLIVRNNEGAGLHLDEGHITLNTEVGEGWTSLRNNGGTNDCVAWKVNTDGWFAEPAAPCVQKDGAYTADGNITATAPIVRDNTGAGFRAEDPEDDGNGNVRVRLGQICGNGEADVGTLEYTMVDTMCR